MKEKISKDISLDKGRKNPISYSLVIALFAIGLIVIFIIVLSARDSIKEPTYIPSTTFPAVISQNPDIIIDGSPIPGQNLPDKNIPDVNAAITTTTILFPQSQGAENIVEIQNMRFVPSELTIHKGDTVTWINKDFVERSDDLGFTRVHKVQAHYNVFSSPRLDQEDTYSFTFKEPGVYTYLDAMFPTKVPIAKVIVVESNKATGFAVMNLDSDSKPIDILDRMPPMGIIMIVSVIGFIVGKYVGFKNKKGSNVL